MLEQVWQMTEEKGEAWMSEEWRNGIVGAYMARADALEMLHIGLGHMPYQWIERMIRRQIIKGYKLDYKTLKALLRERCDVCIRSKKVDAPHKDQLPLPRQHGSTSLRSSQLCLIERNCTVTYVK
jgi:hypothetical protein